MTTTSQLQLREFVQRYCATFTPGNAAAMPAFFHQPVAMIFANTLLVLNTAQELTAAFEQMLQPLAARDFKESRLDRIAITPLGDSTHSVTAVVTRYRQDGSVLEQLGATYTILGRAPDFKIATVIAHDADALTRYTEAFAAAR